MVNNGGNDITKKSYAWFRRSGECFFGRMERNSCGRLWTEEKQYKIC